MGQADWSQSPTVKASSDSAEGIAREEAREEAVAFGGEGVDSKAPAQAVSELKGLFAE